MGVDGVPVGDVEQRRHGISSQRRQRYQPVGPRSTETGVEEQIGG